MYQSWLWQAVWSIFLGSPGWMVAPFIQKNFGIRSEIFVIWYYFAVACGVSIWLKVKQESLIPSIKVCMVIILIGLLFGTATHVLLFKAVAEAPNPGMAISVSQASSVVVFILSLVLGILLPKYFNVSQFNTFNFIGILLVLMGTFLVGYRR